MPSEKSISREFKYRLGGGEEQSSPERDLGTNRSVLSANLNYSEVGCGVILKVEMFYKQMFVHLVFCAYGAYCCVINCSFCVGKNLSLLFRQIESLRHPAALDTC